LRRRLRFDWLFNFGHRFICRGRDWGSRWRFHRRRNGFGLCDLDHRFWLDRGDRFRNLDWLLGRDLR
jgi:hypothetical protein